MREFFTLLLLLLLVTPAVAGEFGPVPKEHQLPGADPRAASATYLVMVIPSTNQVGTYSRVLEVKRFPADRAFSVTFEYQGGRAGVDAITLTVYHPTGSTSTHGPTTLDSKRRAAFSLTLPAGRYALWPSKNATGPSATQLGEQIVVGAPPPTGAYWACRTRFELTFAQVSYTPCARLDVPTWPPQIPTTKLTLPAGLVPFDQVKYLAQDWARLAWVYDLHGFSKAKRHLVSLPNPEETYALGWFPTYFHSSMDGRRIGLTEGDPPVARLGHLAKAIVHPQGRGFYTLEIQGRLGLLETTGRFTPFAGYAVTDSAAPYYSELTVSPLEADKQYARDRQKNIGNWQDAPANPIMRRAWGFTAWPSAAPHDKGLHQFIIADTFRHRLLYVDHRSSHSATDPEGPGTGTPASVKQILGTYGQITRPCLDHPWDVEMDHVRPVSPTVKWIYWTVRGGQPSMTDPPGVPYDPGKAAICRARINLTDGSVIGDPEVFVESAYSQGSEGEIANATGGEYSADGTGRVQAKYPTLGDSGQPGFILPNAIGFYSDGSLWFVEQCAGRLRKVEIETRAITTVVGHDKLDPAERRWLGKPRNCYEITAQNDLEGVLGPRDTIYGGTYAVQSDFAVHADGSQRRILPWTGLSPPPGDYGPGPMHQTLSGTESNYQWVYAPGNAALPCLLAAQQANIGTFLICRRTTGQGSIDRTKLEAGYRAWITSTGGKPAPAVLCSRGGFNAVPAVCFPQLGTAPREQALQYLKDVYAKSDVDADAIVYAAQQAMRYKTAQNVGGAAPTIDLRATVGWTTENATDCAPLPITGQAPLPIPSTFSITCTGPGGTTDSSVTITPSPPIRRERLKR